MKTLDCRGFSCPKPVIMTKKALDDMDKGVIEILIDTLDAKENITKFAANLGLQYEVLEKEGFFSVIINKEHLKSFEAESLNCNMGDSVPIKSFVLVIGSNRLGFGDDKLGEALMKSYIYALSESDVKPNTMLFLNGGVKLTTLGSDVVDCLQLIEESGTEIMSCGTCLDFYGLKEKLLIGSVTNMYTIVSKMNGASNTIKL
jgi:selenium metabolism protein YedF